MVLSSEMFSGRFTAIVVCILFTFFFLLHILTIVCSLLSWLWLSLLVLFDI